MSSDAADTKYCSNCKKDIAVANFTMHEVHCRRHLVLCQHCQEPVPRTEMEEHFNDVHAKVKCTQCSSELEKDQMENHLKRECPKRPAHCEFCELELPHSDLPAHVEFCGTRTEACPRCSNFIMHKDLAQHNSSNCTYPEVKPPPASTNGVGDRRGRQGMFTHGLFGEGQGMFVRGGLFGEMYRGMNDIDMFEFEQIRQALENNEQVVPSFQDEPPAMPSLVTDCDASAAAGEGRPGLVARGTGENKNSRVAGRKKNNTTRGGSMRSTVNKRSETNRRQERAPSPAIPSDVDYDTMLALQLAAEEFDNERPEAEPDPDDDLNQLMNSYSRRGSRRETPMQEEDVIIPASSSSPPPLDLQFDFEKDGILEEDMIPCEFCGETFPSFALVHHQSVCDPLASGLWGDLDDRNNTQPVSSTSATRPSAIPVINNLGPPSGSPQPERKEEEVNHHLTDNGDHLLNSLENIMLPCEFCDDLLPADSLVQHQAMCEANVQTPRVMTPAAAQPASGYSRSNFFPTSSFYGRRQQDPTEDLLAHIRGGEQKNTGGNQRPKKRLNLPHTMPGAVSMTRAPGITRPDHHRSPEESDFTQHSRGSRAGRLESNSRTRHTLDSLLSDNELENTRAQRGRADDDDSPSRRSQGSGAGGTSVSARTVVRTMQQQDRNPHPQPRNAGDEDSQNRRRSQRERGDHVFNSDNGRSQGRQRRSNRQDWS